MKMKSLLTILALLVLTAIPVYAETWSCSFISPLDGQPDTFVWKRVDGGFKDPTEAGSTYKILLENSKVIHLYAAPWFSYSAVLLHKEGRRFVFSYLAESRQTDTYKGRCEIWD